MADLTTISPDDLAAHVAANDVFVLDVRKNKGDTQIYGAISYDRKKLLDAERLVLPLPKSDGLIVIYDEKGDSNDLRTIAAKLEKDGYATIRALDGGFAAWTDADRRTEAKTLEQPVPLVSEHQLSR